MRRALARIAKRTGVARRTASPSTPAATGPATVTRRDDAVQPRPGPRQGWPGLKSTTTPSRPLSSAGRSPGAPRTLQGVGVVGHQHDSGIRVGDAAVVDEADARQLRARTQHLGRGCEQRAALRAAIARMLHGDSVDPERDVVQERAPVDLGKVDAALLRIVERVERATRSFRRQAEVAGEVVARPGGNADERESVGARNRCHESKRTVSARHPERVGRAGHRRLDEGTQLLPLRLDNRVDAPFPGRLGKARTHSRPAPGSGVDEENRALWSFGTKASWVFAAR